MTDGGIVIVRMSAQCALGTTVAACTAALRAGTPGVCVREGLEQAPRVHAGVGQVPVTFGMEVGADRAERLLARALDDLLDEEARTVLAADSAQAAIVVGTTLAGMRHCGAALRAEAAGDSARADRAFRRMPAGAVLTAALAGHPIRGQAVSLSCACASALSAMAHACALLRARAATWVIAGGYDPISEFSYGGFAALQLVAQGELSPFAPEREGMKVGEGCALVLLCTRGTALANGLAPLAEIEGVGEASDAFHLTQPHPEGRGAAAALLHATQGRAPELVLAHGTGTPGNDCAEYAAYQRVFGERLPTIPVAALKSRWGHPLGAAGALDLVLALACADDGFTPAGAGRPVDRGAFPSLDLVQGAVRACAPGRVTALAAGFGGANVAITVVRAAAPSAGAAERHIEPRRGSTHPGIAGVPNGAVPGVHATARAAELQPGALLRGVGAVCASGRGVEGLRSASPEWSASAVEATVAPLLDRTRTRRLALLPRLMLAAVRDLCETAGIEPDELTDVPLLAASWHGAAAFTEQYYRDLIASGIDLANPMLFAESVPNVGSAHVSLGLGITAASATVVGARTVGVQAVGLAVARMRAGDWSRALIVAADEAHPIVDRVLGQCLGCPILTQPGAVALLLERGTSSRGAFELNAGPERACAVPRATSASPCDQAWRLRQEHGACATRAVPELGCATTLGVLALAANAAAPAMEAPLEIGCADPAGQAWCLCVHPCGDAHHASARLEP